ncbi:hypothetical protein [Streptomyces sp. NRRL F-5123]|uniref:hypothetical protein n=1 Tax=Streptomyces sp. NRRL F-5123 TaxID=1463856 RepID=UPI00099B3694|nr:hypothetical protein [Streptomyces sp. NRRL F-5123]
MPGSRRLRRSLVTAAVLTLSLGPVSAALADTPTPSATPTASATPDDSSCSLLVGGAKDYCTSGTPSKPKSPATESLDPLSSLAKGCGNAAGWTIDKLSAAVTKTTEVDFTNTSFLRQYAVVFAASTILTLILWLLAVAKRAVRGVPMTEALTEAVGFLWLTVLASAFTPLILYTVVSATDAVTDVMSSGTKSDTDVFFGSFSAALTKGTDIGGGPIMLIVVSMVSVLAAGVLWLELVIRAALLYVGAMLGTAVYAGLVDKNMWHHVRRWAGVMIAVILVKPVIVIVLGLAGALSSTDDGPDSFSAVVSGLAIILLAIFASFMIYRFVPGFGDDVVNLRNSRKASGQSQAAAVISSPAALVKQGIKTHSARGGPQEQAQGGGAPTPSNPVAGGIAAHSARGGGQGGGAPAPPRPGTGGGGLGAPFRANRGTDNGTSQGGDRG